MINCVAILVSLKKIILFYLNGIEILVSVFHLILIDVACMLQCLFNFSLHNTSLQNYSVGPHTHTNLKHYQKHSG